MSQDQTATAEQKALFVNLVMMLSSSAMQQLGLLVNPLTNKAEVNLEAAQVTIDMLEMLRVTTAGNLADSEDKMMVDILSSLQMNYVTIAKAHPKAVAKAGNEEPAEPDKPATGSDAQAPAKDQPQNDHDARFHKSYG